MTCLGGSTARAFSCHGTRRVNKRAKPSRDALRARAWHRSDSAGPLSLLSTSAASAAAAAAAVLVALQTGLPDALMPAAHAALRSPNAQIARTADAALRRATPAANASVKAIQSKVESVQALLRIPQRKPWGSMARDVKDAEDLARSTSAILVAVPPGKEQVAQGMVDEIVARLERLQFAIDRKDPDKTSVAVAAALQTVSDLEVLQARVGERSRALALTPRPQAPLRLRG